VKPLLRSTVLLAVAAGLLAGPAANAANAASAAPADPSGPLEVAGYDRLGHPQPVREAVRREAVEFFWYDCTHSVQLEQPLSRWAAKHRGDVTLRRIPAVWPGSPEEWVQTAHARLYYTLERLGEVDRLQTAAFRAVHEQELDLTTEERAAAWAVRQGLDEAAFRAAYGSTEVARATAEAPGLFRQYRITELPTVIVDGGERTMPTTAGGVGQMPSVLDQLVAEQ